MSERTATDPLEQPYLRPDVLKQMDLEGLRNFLETYKRYLAEFEKKDTPDAAPIVVGLKKDLALIKQAIAEKESP